MSRCFPYHPPGYTHQSVKKETLIESIKLQAEKQRENEKREKKDERKERKEKKKERKERRKEKKDKIALNLDQSNVWKDYTGLKTCSNPKDELFFQKGRDTKSVQMEKSSLTEEHGQPESLPVPSSSYDSTENSNKRKRQTSATDGSQGHGKFLIRLPSKRESELHSLANGQQSCSISRQTDCSPQLKDDTGLIRDRTKSRDVETCSTSGQSIDLFAPGKTGLRCTPKAVLNPMQELESQYNFLLENCFPPRLDDASLYPVDSDWLFQGQVERAEKRQRSGSESTLCSKGSAVWARAEYLHEIDAYALPYVVPY